MSWIDALRDISIFSVAAFLIQKLIMDSASKNIESFKQQIEITLRSYQLTIDRDLEKYKSDLEFAQTKQSNLHEKRLVILDEMYKQLVDLDSAMRDMTGMHLVYEDGEKENEERVERAQEAFKKYNNYYLYKKIYFTKAVSDLLDNIRKEYYSANWDYFNPQRLRRFTGGKPSPQGYQDAVKESQAAALRITHDIPKILTQMEDQFRGILGAN